MDWTMIGAVGEILGAGGVIVTLGYLANQVKQSTVAHRQEAQRELMDLNNAFLKSLSDSPETASLWLRGMADEPDLTVAEQFQFRTLVLTMMAMWARQLHFHRSQTLDPWFEHMMSTARKEVVTAPGVKRWFEDRGHWLDPDFQAVLKREMENQARYAPLGAPREARDQS